MVRTSSLALHRLALLAAAFVALGALAPNWGVAAGIALPLTVLVVAVQRFPPQTLAGWLAGGGLLFADALAFGLVLVGPASPQPVALAAFSLIVLIATLTRDRLTTLVAAVPAVAAVVAVIAAAGATPTAAEALCLPLLGAAALHFGDLGGRLALRRGSQEEDQAPMHALFDIAEQLTGTLDRQQVMRAIVERVGDLIDTPSCSILLVDERSPGCLVLASKGHPEAHMLQLDLEKYPEVRQVLDTRQPVLIEDVAAHPLVATVRDQLLERGDRSMLLLPLLVGREVLGVLSLKTSSPGAFTPEALRFCKAAAALSANALKNSLLYRDAREAGDKLRRVLDASPDMIVATDGAGRITQFNPGAERLSGWPAAAALGRPLGEVLGRPEPLDPIESGAAVELQLKPKGGEESAVSLLGAPLGSEPGAGRVWIGRDVTRLRRVERSLAQAERLSSLGEIVAGVAHELNNPLSGVVGYAELLRVGAKDPGQVADLDRIVESALRCQKIVLNLLSFARKHTPEKRYHSLNECVEKVLDLKSYHLRASQVQTVSELAPDLPRTWFDFHQIDQVILNLLNNAEQAIHSVRRSGRIVLRTGREGEWLFLEVEDDGPGVSDDVRERIFDPFFTTKEPGQGTGLGLSVSYGIVQEHGGRIEFIQTPGGGGARFRVLLPILPEAAHGTRPVTEVQIELENPLRGKRVLLAEDEPMLLELLARVLSAEGAEVTLARDGEEAWQRVEEGTFDLIVADMCMPRVDGRELYQRVAVEHPEMLRRFVFSTGDLAREETVQFLEHLPNRLLTKPFEVETVRRVLSRAVSA